MPRWSIFTIFNRKYTNYSREITTFAKKYNDYEEDFYYHSPFSCPERFCSGLLFAYGAI